MTIEERAKAYRKETERDVFKSGMDISTMEFEYAYKQGATDQNNVALEAFCKVCGYKKCAERNVRCNEYKDFERLINI